MRKLLTIIVTTLLFIVSGQVFGQDQTAEILSILRSKTAFVTSGTFNGNLGGLEGADEICQNAADEAGLGGTFMAWLSAFEPLLESPGTRFITHSLGPYIDTVGGTVAASYGDLTDSSLIEQIVRDEESGFHFDKDDVWTATNLFGGPRGPNCSNWTDGSLFSSGRVGSTGRKDSKWTDSTTANCSSLKRLYCFEQ